MDMYLVSFVHKLFAKLSFETSYPRLAPEAVAFRPVELKSLTQTLQTAF